MMLTLQFHSIRAARLAGWITKYVLRLQLIPRFIALTQ